MSLAKSLHIHMPADTHHAVVTAEQTMQRIIEAITPVVGPDFFRSLARHLTNVCHVDFACIVMVDQADQATGRAIAASHKGVLVTTFRTTCAARRARTSSVVISSTIHATFSARFQPTSGSSTWGSTATWECRCTDPAASHSG